jgi:hypothetical protein
MISKVLLILFSAMATSHISPTQPPGGAKRSGIMLYVQLCAGEAKGTLRAEIYQHGTSRRPLDKVSTELVRFTNNTDRAFIDLPEGGYQINVYDGHARGPETSVSFQGMCVH